MRIALACALLVACTRPSEDRPAAELAVGGCDDEDQPGEPYGTGYRGPARILRGWRVSRGGASAAPGSRHLRSSPCAR